MSFMRKKGLFETGRILYLDPDTIQPNPEQPRRHFSSEGLEELAESIRTHGILQPLSIRKRSGGYELVAGERRLRAARLARLVEVPCLLVEVSDDTSSLLALVENLQRRDLNFWEEALALEKLIQRYQLSQEEAAQKIGKSQSAVANKLRLLKLPFPVLERLRDYHLTERHARALLKLEDEKLQLHVVEKVIQKDLTVSQTEDLIRGILSPPLPKKQKPRYIVKDVRIFLNSMSRGVSMMQRAGVQAECQQEEQEDALLLTIRIPKKQPVQSG